MIQVQMIPREHLTFFFKKEHAGHVSKRSCVLQLYRARLSSTAVEWMDMFTMQGPQGPLGQQGLQGTIGPTGQFGPEGPQGPLGNVGPQVPKRCEMFHIAGSFHKII